MSIWQAINQAAEQAVGHVRSSLVQIMSAEGSIGAGTIWREDGVIITNAHVVLSHEGQRTLEVVLQDGRAFPAQLLASDEKQDIAALKIEVTGLNPVALGHSSQLKVGEWLMAIGHPWGVLDAITAGIVIGIGDDLPEVGDNRHWLALDMQMRPGHSGGAVFNSAGEMLGMNTMIRGPELSFAVPVDTIKAFLATQLDAPQLELTVSL